ncbi:flagellar hook protein FlgE [Coprothermobacter platensis]|uniref:flagellar hook protein FlgE n=1 Tax=Coprothermobacter platensis TaxID=108819 RepID=UPI00036FFDCD|nr:flagellar hook protein FlgE [Coprothermobacter platensis]
MLRSFSNGIAGLKVHQTRIDVISNNIANVNTTAYKAARATFSDVVALTLKGARAPYGGRGGTNPSQVGLGVGLSTIDNIMTQGATNNTNRTSDLAIQGDGFFVVSDGQKDWFTRDGAFDLDLTGRLIQLSTGLKVQGWSMIPTQKVRFDGTLSNASTASVPISLRVYDNDGVEHVFTAIANASTASNAATVRIYEGTVTASSNAIYTQNLTFANGRVQAGQTGVLNWKDMPINLDFTSMKLENASASALSADGVVEPDTNKVGDIIIPRSLTIPPSPTGNIEFQGNLNANTPTNNNITFTVSNVIDSLGVTHSMLVNAVKNASPNEWAITVSTDAGSPKVFTLKFDENGRINDVRDEANNSLGTMPVITLDVGGGAMARNIMLNFSSITQYAADSKVVGLVDGNTNGKLLNWFVTDEGKVMGEFDNGQIKELAEIALGNFQNPAGLSRSGNNLWASTANSGFRGYAEAGTMGSLIMSGALESSNVDLAEEFTNLIITQRGFQANTRVITTSDEVTQDIIGLKR